MQAKVEPTAYPTWALAIAFSMILAGVLPMPIVYLLRRFQILGVDLDIHQGSIRRNETTASTKVMMDDDDVSVCVCILRCIVRTGSNTVCLVAGWRFRWAGRRRGAEPAHAAGQRTRPGGRRRRRWRRRRPADAWQPDAIADALTAKRHEQQAVLNTPDAHKSPAHM